MKKTAKPPMVVRRPITVTVTGPPKCGKSILSMLIARILRENGFSATLEDPEMTKTAIRYRQKNLLKLARHLVRLDRAEIVVCSKRKGGPESPRFESRREVP